uniref:YEATS domain-containing protein n=1 Tax=Sparus aurata TaxID=8175 RepID=A0A671WU60_SPAAU
MCKVQVNLELGHNAQLREKETSEDFTHDWTVFVRGQQTDEIQHMVEKVVFHLHESYPKPKRGMTEQSNPNMHMTTTFRFTNTVGAKV